MKGQRFRLWGVLSAAEKLKEKSGMFNQGRTFKSTHHGTECTLKMVLLKDPKWGGKLSRGRERGFSSRLSYYPTISYYSTMKSLFLRNCRIDVFCIYVHIYELEEGKANIGRLSGQAVNTWTTSDFASILGLLHISRLSLWHARFFCNQKSRACSKC